MSRTSRRMKLIDFQNIGLPKSQLDVLSNIVGNSSFDAQEAAEAYINAGHPWTDVVMAYQFLVNAGRLPDRGVIWKIARITFREQPESNAHLRKYADNLNTDNWKEAKAEARATAKATARASMEAERKAARAAEEMTWLAEVAGKDGRSVLVARLAEETAWEAWAAWAKDRVGNEIIDLIVFG